MLFLFLWTKRSQSCFFRLNDSDVGLNNVELRVVAADNVGQNACSSVVSAIYLQYLVLHGTATTGPMTESE